MSAQTDKLSGVRRLALITTLATYLLISVGGFVRAAGAGLGCPDWPKCYGRWIPPTDASQLPPEVAEQFNFTKAWIEYINRLVGVIIGLLILATFVLSVTRARGVRGVIAPITLALLFVGFQGWFGGQVVKYELDPRFVTVHLVIALFIAGLLVYATRNTYERSPVQSFTRTPRERRLCLLQRVNFGLAFGQVMLGAVVRGSLDLIAEHQPALARGDRIGEVGWIDPLHREVSILVALGVALSYYLARTESTPNPVHSLGRKIATANLGIVLAQIAAGIALAYFGLPPAAQVLHLTLGSWLVTGLFLQLLVPIRSTTMGKPQGDAEVPAETGLKST